MTVEIYIATVHWPVGKWIDIQRYYLDRNINTVFRQFLVVAPGTDTGSARFDYVHSSAMKDHAGHLNHLLSKVLETARSDDDILVFLDGDAFPIAPLDKYLERRLADYRLIAVQRPENRGEYLPHPCFCAARIDCWRELGAAWGKAESGTEFGNDPGGRMLETITQNNIAWGKIFRSNKIDIHPLFFGVYDDVIYHHGAGFRDPISRLELADAEMMRNKRMLRSRIAEFLPDRFCLDWKRRVSPYRREEFRIIRKNRELQKEVFKKLTKDREFYRGLI
jgi:hypothetical protein